MYFFSLITCIHADEGDGRGRGGGESDVDEESDDDDYGDAEEQLASMMQRIDELQNEKNGLLVLNSELQKKAVALIAREKAMQGQTAAARTAAEVLILFAGFSCGHLFLCHVCVWWLGDSIAVLMTNHRVTRTVHCSVILLSDKQSVSRVNSRTGGGHDSQREPRRCARAERGEGEAVPGHAAADCGRTAQAQQAAQGVRPAGQCIAVYCDGDDDVCVQLP